MSDSETQADFKVIKTKIDFMEQMLDNHINNYPTLKQIQAQDPRGMSLNKALNIVLELAEDNSLNIPDCKQNKPELLSNARLQYSAIAKVKEFIQQL